MSQSYRSVASVVCLSAITSFVATTQSASAATFTPFVIRNNANPTTPLTITDFGGVVTTTIDESGEKTGYGTKFFDGMSVNMLGKISYTRVDSGLKNPYLNVWVTDGTNYAILAPLRYNNYGIGGAPVSSNVNGLWIQDLGINVYETNTANLGWLAPDAVYNSAFQGLATGTPGNFTPVKVSDLYSLLTINDPGIYPTPPIGTGPPKNGTGFNLIFGDTQGNFVQPVPYVINGVSVSVVPEPSSLALIGVGALALLRRRRQARAV